MLEICQSFRHATSRAAKYVIYLLQMDYNYWTAAISMFSRYPASIGLVRTDRKPEQPTHPNEIS